jgi:hypothetical protein
MKLVTPLLSLRSGPATGSCNGLHPKVISQQSYPRDLQWTAMQFMEIRRAMALLFRKAGWKGGAL